MTTRAARIFLVAVLVLAGCSGRGMTPQQSKQLPMPQSVSPALIPPAPMAKTAILPSSAMPTTLRPMTAIEGLNWTQLSGTASQVAASPDGSVWALSADPGADKHIWHYVLGTWTNISGLAAHIAVAPNGTLYAINSGGGTYSYNGSSWTALGGGASGITIASDNSVYVLSNSAPAGSDQAIWHNNGSWTQMPGSGTMLAASWDTAGPFSEPVGTIVPGGFYVLNSAGEIWYENSDGTFAKLSGAASAIAPTTTHGTFVLAYPSNPNWTSIYYYDLNTGTWTLQPGAGASLSANRSDLYVVSAQGGIYFTAVTPVPQNMLVPNYASGSSASISQWPVNANGNQAPSLQITGSNTTLIGPTAVARDSSGNIYVADFDAAAIDVFAAGANGNVTPLHRISGSQTGISGLEGIGVDAGGNIYISNRASNTVEVFASGADGNVAPTRVISGTNTLLSTPQQLVVNTGGDFYVSNSSGNSILYFAANANGNVVPARVLAGSNTGLNHTFGVAVDPNGLIYALNGTAITIYPAASNGNVVPARTISGSNTGLNGNEGMAVDNDGNMYVTECGSPNAVLVFAATDDGNVAPSQTISGSSTSLNCPLKPAVF
ncbi:MAG TPA: hypothetical protein VFW34_08745 [Candidatus Rubrimentiphilum sp.]|nr:hypothetical protein [Candidatus Rubrimentiphilum sp.]